MSFQLFVWLFQVRNSANKLLGAYCVAHLSQVAHVQDEPLTLSLAELAHTFRGAATISFAVLSVAAMAVFIYIEASF